MIDVNVAAVHIDVNVQIAFNLRNEIGNLHVREHILQVERRKGVCNKYRVEPRAFEFIVNEIVTYGFQYLSERKEEIRLRCEFLVLIVLFEIEIEMAGIFVGRNWHAVYIFILHIARATTCGAS